MVNSLSAFFAQNAKKIENKKIIVSERFVDAEGKPIPFEITCITSTENQKIKSECTKPVPVPGKKGQYTYQTDAQAYQTSLVTHCVVSPDLKNSELQDSYGVMSAEQLIGAMLTPAEFDDLVISVVELCGFSSDDDLIDEAKN